MTTFQTQLILKPPAPFHFEATAHSHGWVVLAPNAWDDERHTVRRVERLSDGCVVWLEMSGAGSIDQPEVRLDVRHGSELARAQQNELLRRAGHMLRVDEDFAAFYALCRERGEPWTQLTQGMGRLLRSPTLFEDAVKTICTVNINWGGTRSMVARLVKEFGEPFPGEPERRAFPTPAALAALSAEEFASRARLGFRNPYVYTLAQRVVSGELELESYQASDLSTPELKKKLLSIKGVGNYAAATLLMLVGRYDELAVDTAFRSFMSQKYFNGQYPSDQEAQAVHADWGPWKYLAYWFDIWSAYS